MFGYLKLILSVLFVIVNSAVCSTLICILAIVKFVLPVAAAKTIITLAANKVMWLWATLNSAFLSIFNKIEWDIEGGENLNPKGWYLMISNHLSWTDIVILCCVFKDRVPMPKFFLKQQLLYVPFVGMACWALDMPFMKRYSREYLIRNPHLKGKDLQTTRRSCEKFKHIPTTVVNYVEGTRFTAEKKAAGKGRFNNLLPPKSGGIAYTLAAMGEQFDSIIDVTLAYPDNRELPFKDMLMGRMKRVVVRIKVLPVDEQVSGDYFNDKPYKRAFQGWLTDVWQQKDKLLDEIYNK
ncbi:acyltransferase [Vibrio sp. SCSIO 43137]|uniref:acyltransferase n=1 Tax=Vibrio sp. SCSIO 43137 TaxID=3021011 RepID=UPI0023074785|nr:acyltransferase [Vibrio sp. SCSIO 43137]WCE29722.1 acyltransferase [Vibrio sp. SCSIO 43137]